MKYKILVINPGSTSTKIAVYEDEQSVFQKTLRHSTAEIEQFPTVPSQYSFRKETILKELAVANIGINNLNAVIGRGGVVKPVESGVYEVNDALKEDLIHSRMGQHASNLGGLIADDVAHMIPGARAFIADPVVVDELDDVARITGHPLLPHQSIFHALNQKAIARKFAKDTGRRYEDLDLIVAHLGGGISIGAHRKGRIVDVNNALNGYGPFSPERAGTLPALQLAELCFSGIYTIDEVRAMITGKGGLVAHIGINDVQEACKRASEGDATVAHVLKAMAYGIAKAIGSAYAVLKGKIDGILLTGGIAYNDLVVKHIVEHVESFGTVSIYPGEDEMGALAMNALGVLKGEMECKVY